MTAPPLPDAATLTAGQATGNTCARCDGPLFGPIPIGRMYNELTGKPIDLWSCMPCASPAEAAGAFVPDGRQCVVCKEPADAALVLIGRVEGNSGPGYTAYAHKACAREAGHKPLD